MKKDIFNQRIKRVLKKLAEGNGNSCLALESAPERIKSGTNDTYVVNPDFYYLTGSKILNAVLLISNAWEKPIIITNKPNPLKVVWDGPQESAEKLAREIKADLIYTEELSFLNIILSKIRSFENLYCPKQQASHLNQVLFYLNSLDKLTAMRFPRSILSTEAFVATERLIKDPEEIELMQKAIQITGDSLAAIQHLITPGMPEANLTAALEFQFKIHGANGLAFNTIMASGKNAAVLHYHQNSSKLKKDDYLLIDCGAEYQNYCADISRCYPVGGDHRGIYAEIYQIVLSANEAAIAKVKDKAQIKNVYLAAAKELTIGLKELGVLKGKVSELMAKRAFAPYFVHSIGHSLGMETHDPGGHREGKELFLKTGMVFTIEPGLYFSKATKNIPAGGIRIEDDILVTKTGYKNLSQIISK